MFLPGCGAGALVGSGRSVPWKFFSTAAFASATTSEPPPLDDVGAAEPAGCDSVVLLPPPQAALSSSSVPVAATAGRTGHEKPLTRFAPSPSRPGGTDPAYDGRSCSRSVVRVTPGGQRLTPHQKVQHCVICHIKEGRGAAV